MVNQNQNQPKSEHKQFVYGNVAARLAGNENDIKYIPASLDLLAKDLGLGDKADGFVQGAYASEKGMQKVIQVYAGKYEKEIGKLNVSSLYSEYSSVLAGASSEAKNKIKAAFDKHSGENWGKLNKEISKANFIYGGKAPEGVFNEEDKKKAEETLRKYQDFIQAQGMLDSYKFEESRAKAVEATKKKDLESLVKK